MTRHAVVVLGGNGPKNIEWVRRISGVLRKDFTIYSLDYIHWSEGSSSQDINFEAELLRLEGYVKDLDSYSIVAKSAGLLLTLMAINKGVISPESVVGFGLPLEFAQSRGLELTGMLNQAAKLCSLLCIQAKLDPQGTASDVHALLPSEVLLKSIPGDTHDYNQYEKLSSIAKTFINLHLPLEMDAVNRVEAPTFIEALQKVYKRKTRFRFRNRWLFNPKKSITIFSYQGTTYIAKFVTDHKKAFLEADRAGAFAHLMQGVRLGNYEVEVVVPNAYTLDDNTSAVVSPYVGEDCNELFYGRHALNLDAHDIYTYAKTLTERNVRYPGFLPRNTILMGSRAYFVDFESVRVDEAVSIEDQTTILIGWSIVPNLVAQYASNLYGMTKSDAHLASEYEKVLAASVSVKELSITERPAVNTIALTAEEHVDASFSKYLMKRDDTVNIISEYTTASIEAQLDEYLYVEKKRGTDEMYRRASSLAKMIRLNSELPIRYQINIQNFTTRALQEILQDY